MMQKQNLTNSLAAEEQPVVFFDSGMGGLSYLEQAVRQLPAEYFYYYADTAYFPYGEKDTQTIRKRITQVMDRIIGILKPKCIVIACNTASVSALSLLRETFPLPFIGVVPAVKPAAAGSVKKKFGVLATLRTVKAGYLTQLITAFAQTCEVKLLPAGDLADLVEKEFFSLTKEQRLQRVRHVIEVLDMDDLDAIVLACTHFVHLEEEFRQLLGSRIRLIDSREGVINQLCRVLKQQQLQAAWKKGSNRFYLSEEDDQAAGQYRLFAAKYELEYAGVL